MEFSTDIYTITSFIRFNKIRFNNHIKPCLSPSDNLFLEPEPHLNRKSAL